MSETRYPAEVFWVEEDNAWFATSSAFGPGVSAYGDSAAEAIAEFQIALELALESYADRAIEPPAPHSGKLSLRLPKSLHAQLARRAETEDVSLNMLLVSYLAERSGRKGMA